MQTAAEVIRALQLVPHPEGGCYREVHRSTQGLGALPGYPAERVALTVIHFLLEAADFSAFHRVRSEELWVHLGGADLELVVLEERPRVHRLSPVGGCGAPLAVVPPGALQAARSLGAWALATCAVAPGFEFADFEIPSRRVLLDRYPEEAALVKRYTR